MLLPGGFRQRTGSRHLGWAPHTRPLLLTAQHCPGLGVLYPAAAQSRCSSRRGGRTHALHSDACVTLGRMRDPAKCHGPQRVTQCVSPTCSAPQRHCLAPAQPFQRRACPAPALTCVPVRWCSPPVLYSLVFCEYQALFRLCFRGSRPICSDARLILEEGTPILLVNYRTVSVGRAKGNHTVPTAVQARRSDAAWAQLWARPARRAACCS